MKYSRIISTVTLAALLTGSALADAQENLSSLKARVYSMIQKKKVDGRLVYEEAFYLENNGDSIQYTGAVLSLPGGSIGNSVGGSSPNSGVAIPPKTVRQIAVKKWDSSENPLSNTGKLKGSVTLFRDGKAQDFDCSDLNRYMLAGAEE